MRRGDRTGRDLLQNAAAHQPVAGLCRIPHHHWAPVQLAKDEVSHRESGVTRLDHLAHSHREQWVGELELRDVVVGKPGHASAHVWVDGQVQRFYQQPTIWHWGQLLLSHRKVLLCQVPAEGIFVQVNRVFGAHPCSNLRSHR